MTLGVIAMVLLVLALWYVAQPHCLGPPCLCRRRRSGSGQALRHPDQDACCSRVYTLSGVIAAFAAWVSIGRNGSISPSSAVTDYNLQAITAAVIGGISLFGGRGSILGTLFGAMIVGVVSMGLNMLGADPQWKVC